MHHRILMAAPPVAGAVLAMTGIAAAAVARGHTVRFTTGHAYEDRVTATGATFIPLPRETDLTAAELLARRPDTDLRGARLIEANIRRVYLDHFEAQHRHVLARLDDEPTDAIIADPLLLGAAAVALRPRAERPLVVLLGLTPLVAPDPAVPPYGLGRAPRGDLLDVPRNLLLDLAARTAFLRHGRGFQREVQRVTGARVTRRIPAAILRGDLVAQLSVPEFEYPRRALPNHVRFVGPVRPAFLGDQLPHWWDDTDDRPLVHVTQGTIENLDFGDLVIPALRALAGLPVRVVVTTGGPPEHVVDEALGGRLPHNCRVARFLPYDQLLPAASLVVTNGGFGGVQHALRYGVPLVVAGTRADKQEVNARVAWTGAGIDLRTNRPTVEAVRDAVQRVLHDQRYRAAAVRIGAAISGTDAPRAVVGLVESALDAGQPVAR